jgi:hypothetical protein
MKTKEEIDELYHKLYSISIDGEDNLHYYSFVEGYTQCQQDMAKKYTEEDLENAFNSGRGYGVPDNIKDFNSFINSLNKQDYEK